MSDTVTKAELAEVCRMIAAEKDGCSIFTGDWIKLADRLDPPKPRWPKVMSQHSLHNFGEDVEVYPTNIVLPVVDALRRANRGWEIEEVKTVLAAFDEACKGER